MEGKFRNVTVQQPVEGKFRNVTVQKSVHHFVNSLVNAAADR